MMTRHSTRIVSLAALVSGLAGAAHAIVVSTTMVTSGNWSLGTNWTINPRVPNNGQPAADDVYNVFLFNRTAVLDQDITVNDLHLQHSSGTTNVIDNQDTTPHTLTIEGALNFRQGNLAGNNTYIIKPAAAVNFLPTPVGLTKQLNATLKNEGTVNIDFLTTLQSTGPGTHLINEPGGVINFNNSTTLSRTAGSTGAKFTNKPGAVINNGGTFDWEFENHGTVNVNTVSLNASRGGTHTGTFNVAQGRTARFSGAGFTHTLTQDSVLAGSGSVEFSTTTVVQTPAANYTVNRTVVNGEVIFEGTAEEFSRMLERIEIASGKLAGDSIVTSSVTWRGGEVNSNLTINPGGTLDGVVSVPAERILSGNLTNNGQANLKGTIRGDTLSGPATFTNSGTLNSSNATTFTGDGTFVNDGGFIVASANMSIAWEFIASRNSNIEATLGARLFVEKARLLEGEFLVGSDSLARLTVQPQDQFLASVNAVLAIQGGLEIVGTDGQTVAHAALDIDSTVQGSGTFSIDGRFDFFNQTKPGNSPGTLTIQAPVTEFHPEHRLTMELGAPGSAEVDLLIVHGDLILGGTINILPLPGFGPGTYTLIDCTGTLTDNGVVIGDIPSEFAAELQIDTLAGIVTLVVTEESLCPADFNRDGGVDGEDVTGFFTQWEMGEQSADVNGDGGIDGDDVIAFFLHWESGC